MRILRNIVAKQGTRVIQPQLKHMQLLVPSDHFFFVEAQHKLDMGPAFVQVMPVTHSSQFEKAQRCKFAMMFKKFFLI
jgi:hypothetical protein